MGAFLDKPKTDKEETNGQGNGLRYGISSMQGWRIEMEDSHVAKVELPHPFETWSYFGIFDGHAGSRVSELCSSQLFDVILNTDEFKKLSQLETRESETTLIKNGLVNGFLAFDSELAREQSSEKSGSTAVVSIITPTHIFIANCGDSRAVLVRDNKLCLATEDHKPNNPIEHRRIVAAGGHVMLSRVNGSLAVSRSLGDFEYKQVRNLNATAQLVSPEPDVFIMERKKENDQFMVLACDGIWDVFDNDDLVEYALHRLNCTSSLINVCSDILDTSLHKGSRDNMSVLLVALDNAPTVDPELARKDAELNRTIEALVLGLVKSEHGIEELTVNNVVNMICSKQLPDYPPGGPITKRTLIEKIFLDSLSTDSQLDSAKSATS